MNNRKIEGILRRGKSPVWIDTLGHMHRWNK